MDVMQAIQKRRSIRNFQSREVEEDKLRGVLEAGRLAPSARNMQNWKFIVVRDPETRKKLSEAAKGQAFVAEAPVVIVACGTDTDYMMTCGQHAYSIDVAIAVDHMTLEATDLGLGTCWIGAFYEQQVKDMLDIPQKARVVALLPLGYPAQSPPPTRRKELEEITSEDRWA